jgi:hypothetical protein
MRIKIPCNANRLTAPPDGRNKSNAITQIQLNFKLHSCSLQYGVKSHAMEHSSHKITFNTPDFVHWRSPQAACQQQQCSTNNGQSSLKLWSLKSVSLNFYHPIRQHAGLNCTDKCMPYAGLCVSDW